MQDILSAEEYQTLLRQFESGDETQWPTPSPTPPARSTFPAPVASDHPTRPISLSHQQSHDVTGDADVVMEDPTSTIDHGPQTVFNAQLHSPTRSVVQLHCPMDLQHVVAERPQLNVSEATRSSAASGSDQPVEPGTPRVRRESSGQPPAQTLSVSVDRDSRPPAHIRQRLGPYGQLTQRQQTENADFGRTSESTSTGSHHARVPGQPNARGEPQLQRIWSSVPFTATGRPVAASQRQSLPLGRQQREEPQTMVEGNRNRGRRNEQNLNGEHGNAEHRSEVQDSVGQRNVQTQRLGQLWQPTSFLRSTAHLVASHHTIGTGNNTENDMRAERPELNTSWSSDLRWFEPGLERSIWVGPVHHQQGHIGYNSAYSGLPILGASNIAPSRVFSHGHPAPGPANTPHQRRLAAASEVHDGTISTTYIGPGGRWTTSPDEPAMLNRPQASPQRRHTSPPALARIPILHGAYHSRGQTHSSFWQSNLSDELARLYSEAAAGSEARAQNSDGQASSRHLRLPPRPDTPPEDEKATGLTEYDFFVKMACLVCEDQRANVVLLPCGALPFVLPRSLICCHGADA